MILKKKPNGWWTEDRIRQEALKYNTPSEFQRGSKGAYLAALRSGILDKVCLHMTIKTYWTFESLQAEALKHKTKSSFKNTNPGAYQIAYERGILDKVCSHMTDLLIYWFDSMIASEALKYTRRKDFAKGAPGAYNAAKRKGILDQVCSHMPKIRTIWTDDMLAIEALKYKTRVAFQKGSNSAYMLSLTRDILDKICTHMKAARGSSIPERALMSAIKDLYPNAKKFKDTKVKIEGKPYIYGFEIDILVGNLGIEFDGKRHHSYEYMRDCPQKALWSDDEVHGYHKIKDDYFWVSKGIKILHIKEVDWDLDKQACIQRCLDFLASK